jgi:anthranilate synthase component 1
VRPDACVSTRTDDQRGSGGRRRLTVFRETFALPERFSVFDLPSLVAEHQQAFVLQQFDRTSGEPIESRVALKLARLDAIASDAPTASAFVMVEAQLHGIDIDGAGECRSPGGVVGFVGYDGRGQPEGCPGTALFAVERFLVLDHVHRTGSIIHVADAAEARHPDAIRRELVEERQRIVASATAPLRRPADFRPRVNASPSAWTADTDRAAHRRHIDQVKRRIGSGDVERVVLSIGFSRAVSADPWSIYREICAANPSPCAFYIRNGEFALVGATPLMLLRTDGDTVLAETDAGTRPRGRTVAEDQALREDLLRSPKDREEHRIIADAMRYDLAKIAKDVVVCGEPEVRCFSHVMHLVTEMQTRLGEHVSPVGAVQAAFPAAAVTGAPKAAAMRMIADMEGRRRGPYGGIVGLFGYDGTCDVAVTLRSLWIAGGIAHLRAGGGIVAGSDADQEYDECLQKAQILFECVERAEHEGA